MLQSHLVAKVEAICFQSIKVEKIISIYVSNAHVLASSGSQTGNYSLPINQGGTIYEHLPNAHAAVTPGSQTRSQQLPYYQGGTNYHHLSTAQVAGYEHNYLGQYTEHRHPHHEQLWTTHFISYEPGDNFRIILGQKQ